MITEYIMYFIVLPLFILWNIKLLDRSDEKQLLSKEDTVALRGISAFFVIAAHFMFWVDEMIGYTTDAIVKGVVGQLGGIGVLIFFFVSGYGLYESYGNRKVDRTYVVKRLKGVYFPYIIIKLIFLVINHLLGISDIDIGTEILSVIFVEDWFIHVIVILYIVFYIAAKLNKKYMLTINIAADCVLAAVYLYQDKPIGWFNALWLFTFGIFVSKYQDKIISLGRKYYYQMITASLMGFVLMGGIFAINKGLLWANIFKPLSGMFLCMGICMIMRKCKLTSLINMWGGGRSLHLYIVHISIWNLVRIDKPIIRFWVALELSIMITEIMFRITNYICGKAFRKIADLKSR